MVKTDPNLRKRMMQNREKFKPKGVIIDKSAWRKGTIRILPNHGRDVGFQCWSVYSQELKKSVTCPRSFGLSDPLLDYLDSKRETGTKDEQEHMRDAARVTREYWVACVVRGDEGTPKAPNVRCFRFPGRTYEETVFEWLTEEPHAEDITDVREGRDLFVSKKGEGRNTKWKVNKLDQSPLSKSKEMRIALTKLAKGFDVRMKFYPFSLEDYESVYQAVTGEELDPEAREELEKLDEAGGRMVPDADTDPAQTDDDPDEEERPLKKPAKKKPSAKSKARRSDDDDDDDDDADGDTDQESDDDSDDSDDDSDDADDSDDDDSDDADDEDSDDDDADDDDADDDDDSDDADDEAEEAEPAVRGGKSKTGKSKPGKVKPGKVKPGKVKPGKVKPGKAKVDKAKPANKTRGKAKVSDRIASSAKSKGKR